MSRPARNGIALLLVTGILTLLAFAGTAMVSIAARSRTTVASALDAAQARLLARSGIGYAMARLFENSAPKEPRTLANQPDDWIYRDGIGVPLETARNPSYAQAEPYWDLNGNGAYDDGLDGFTDLDGNARFDSWSGRLRGRYRMTGGTFALKVTGDGGKISVNGGLVGATNLNGNSDTAGRPVPDYNETGSEATLSNLYWDLPENGRVVDLIDSLMEVLSPPPVGAGRYSVGARILRSRPLGGYRSLEPVKAVLTPAEWAALRGYLTLQIGGLVQGVRPGDSEYITQRGGQWGQPRRTYPYRPDRRMPILLDLADPLLLQALFRNLTAQVHPIRRFAPPKDAPFVMHLNGASITPLDARLLSDFLASHRSFPSWYELYQALDRNKSTIFPSAAQQAAEAPLSLYYYTQARFLPTSLEIQNQMVDLAFTNACPDAREVRDNQSRHCWIPPLSWASYDVDRQGSPSAPSRLERDLIMSDVWRYRPAAGSGAWSLPVPSAPVCTPVGSLELSLEGARQPFFNLQSLGRVVGSRGSLQASSRSEATFQTTEVLSIRTQDEFENSGSGKTWGLPMGVSSSGRPEKDRIQTYPMFPRDSCPDWKGHPDYDRGSPYCGDLRLMDYSSGERRTKDGCVFYAPMWEEGQPLRDPLHSNGWLENFRDIVGGADARSGWTIDNNNNPAPDEWPVRDLLQSGTTALSFFKSSSTYDNAHVIPGSLFPSGAYTWGPGGKTPGYSPLVVDDAISSGTIELWSAQTCSYYTRGSGTPFLALWVEDTIQWSMNVQGQSVDLVSPGFYSQPDWHHVAVAFDRSGITLYADGIAALSDGMFESAAVDPNKLQGWGMSPINKAPGFVHESVGQDELRFYRNRLDGAAVLANALQGRFWTRFSAPNRPDLDTVPSYLSPEYRFDRPAVLTHVHWDGFVPKLVAEAVDDTGASPPMRVELLFGVGREERIVELPPEFWRTGGGGKGLEISGVRSLRYRVWMDVSAVGGVNNETPVFDGISIAYRVGGEFLSFEMEQ